MNSFVKRSGNIAGKIVDGMSSVAGFTGGVILSAVAIIITIDVILRYVFNSPTSWAGEVSIILVIAAVFLTVSFGLKEGSHINVQVFIRILPSRTRDLLEIISYIFVLSYAVVFVRYAINMVITSISLSEASDFLNLPLWPVKLVVVIAFFILCLQALRMLITKSYSYITGQSAEAGKPVVTSLVIGGFLLIFVAGLYMLFNLNGTVGLLILLILLLTAGVPISFTMGIVGTFGFISVLDLTRGLAGIPQVAYWTWDSFTVMALPLFVFVGYIMYKSGLADELFNFARQWLGHLPGGLAVAAVTACAVFAAISGSSAINAATIGLVAIPAMVSYKYNKKMAAGLVAVGGTLGVLIPPSSAMILIGIMTDESIGHLFMAGLVPGIMIFIMLAITAVIVCKVTGSYEPLPRIPVKERIKNMKGSIGSLLLPLIILGGIYTGVFTPTEAAAVAVTYALVFAVFIKKMKSQQLVEVIRESTKTVAMAAILISGAIALGNVVAMLRVTQDVTTFFVNSGWSPWVIIFATMVLILILGMFLDGSAIVLLTMPILAPLIRSLGFDMLWYSVLFVVNTEIGCITPPIGINIYIIQQISDVDAFDVIRGAIPFLVVMLIALVILAFVPQLSLWLPGTMR